MSEKCRNTNSWSDIYVTSVGVSRKTSRDAENYRNIVSNVSRTVCSGTVGPLPILAETEAEEQLRAAAVNRQAAAEVLLEAMYRGRRCNR